MVFFAVALPEAERYYLPVIRELMETALKPGEVWNVNFPSWKNGEPKGILRDRAVAPTSMFRESYIEVPQPDGSILLSCKGTPTQDCQIPEGTDAKAVRQGYISIGRVTSAPM